MGRTLIIGCGNPLRKDDGIGYVVPADLSTSTLTHDLQPSVLLACACRLYDSNPDMFLVSITGESFDFGNQFSNSVAAALPESIRCVSELVAAKDQI
jgi:Ni,Fe-hydrogenase maturation factor